MSFLENAFALLNTDGDDTKLLTPVAAVSKAEKKSDDRKDNNKPKPQSQAAHNVSAAATPTPPRSGRSEYGRGGLNRGSEGYNANGSNTFYNGRNDAPQRNNNGHGNGYRKYDGRSNGDKQYGGPQRNNGQGNVYRRYDGHANGNQQYGGYGDGCQQGEGYQQSKEGNSYNKFNIQFGSHELNSNVDYSQYRRDSASAGYEKNGSKPQEWREHGGDIRREFNKMNGSSNGDNVPEADQQFRSQSQEKKLAVKGKEHQVKNEGWNLVGDRRGNRRRGNSPSIGAISGGKGEASIYKAKEKSLIGEEAKDSLNGEAKDSDVKSATTEGEERNGASNEAEPKQRRRNREGNQSKDLNKEEMKVREPYVPTYTLDKYERDLVQKREALEALKQEERKVIMDQDFEVTQLIGRRKEDLATKLNSEKGNADEEQESIEKEEKVKAAINQPRNMTSFFLKDVKRSFPVYRRNFESDGRGHGGSGEQEGVDYRRDFGTDGRGRGGRGGGRSGYRRDFERDGSGDERGQGGGYYRRDFGRDGGEATPIAAVDSKANVSKAVSIDIRDNKQFPGLRDVLKP